MSGAQAWEYAGHIFATYWKTMLGVFGAVVAGVLLVVWVLSAFIPVALLSGVAGLVIGYLYSSITVKLICKAEGVPYPPRFSNK